MFNYTRSNKPIKKPVNKKPMTPIEMEVNMPIQMQPVPQTDPAVTCIYPHMSSTPNMTPQPIPPMPQPAPMPPMSQPAPMPPVSQPTPMPLPMPCINCGMPHPYMTCMHGNMYNPQPSCDMSKYQDDMEVTYIKKMYPPLCKKVQKYIDCELNQYDHDLSPIYEMYPSSQTIDHIANCIYTDMKADMCNLIKEFEGNPNTRLPIGGSFYTLVYVMLLNELYRKRMRRRLYR